MAETAHPIDNEIARLEAELKLKKQERKFVEAKLEGKVTQKMKLDLREARQHFRENFRDRVAVNPASLGASADVAEAEGSS